MCKKSYRSLLLFLFSLSFFCSCDSGSSTKKKGGEATARAQSAPYELLVVANKEWLKTSSGEVLMGVLKTPIEGLPQMEESFRVTSVNPAAWKGVFEGYSNTVVVDVDRKYTKPEMRVERNVTCRPQTLVRLCAPSKDDVARLADDNRNAILKLFNGRELERERTSLASHHSSVVMNKAQNMFGASINAPKEIDHTKAGKDFFWGSASAQQNRMNVCVYSVSMRSLDVNSFIALRDSVMRVNIPGEHDDQWMETDGRFVTYYTDPSADVTAWYSHGNKSSLRLVATAHGLWDMRHDAMGGPFVCYVFADEASQRLLIAEGFVFAPEKDKRAFIRQLEAALQSLVL